MSREQDTAELQSMFKRSEEIRKGAVEELVADMDNNIPAKPSKDWWDDFLFEQERIMIQSLQKDYYLAGVDDKPASAWACRRQLKTFVRNLAAYERKFGESYYA